MIVGPRAIALIKRFETCRLDCYLPTPQDRPTIGWGTTGHDIALGMSWTQAKCDARFERDLGAFARGVESLLVKAATTPAQFGAMVSLAYNIGLHAFERSSVLRLHRVGDKAGAAAAFLAWDKAGGKVLAGLAKRRKAERDLYLGMGL